MSASTEAQQPPGEPAKAAPERLIALIKSATTTSSLFAQARTYAANRTLAHSHTPNHIPMVRELNQAPCRAHWGSPGGFLATDVVEAPTPAWAPWDTWACRETPPIVLSHEWLKNGVGEFYLGGPCGFARFDPLWIS